MLLNLNAHFNQSHNVFRKPYQVVFVPKANKTVTI